MKFKKTVLKNGLRIITAPSADAPTVTMLVTVETGSKYETKDINGLSHFFEHMCFKGTERRPSPSDISRELDSIGAHYNASTSFEYTNYYAKSHPKHVAKLVDVVSDMYNNPIFKAEEIEKEKGVIVQEIMMYEDLPQKKVFSVLADLLYGGQPAGLDIAGTPELVKSFNRDHFLKYRREHYVASSTIVTVAGNFDDAKIIFDIEKAFERISTGSKSPKVPVSESQNAPAVRFRQKETDQTHLILAARAFDAKDKRLPTLNVLSTVLGNGMSSRLFHKMRDEMGVCYYVRSGVGEFTDHGFLAVSAGVDSRRIEESVGAIVSEFRRLKEEPVPPAELSKAKEQIIGDLYLGLESSDSIAEFLTSQEVVEGKILTPDEYTAKSQAVSAADVREVANEIFKPGKLNLVLISAHADEAELGNILKKV